MGAMGGRSRGRRSECLPDRPDDDNSGFSTAPVPDSVFAIPEGYKQLP